MALFIRQSEIGGEREVTRWRFVSDKAVDGALNMAVDETLLESVIAGGAPAVRFYSWAPATLSLGVNQPLGEIDLAECARRGFGVVRRPTGGRAVLHQHELTYSVIAPTSDPRVSGGVVESYRKISGALLAGLEKLGVRAALAPPNPALRQALLGARRTSGEDDQDWSDGEHGAVCFDAASDYELTAGGRKLVGSAQARRGGVVLQHGSLLLDVDWEAWAAVFAYRTEAGRARAREKLPARMTSLVEQLGRRVDFEEVARALIMGFEDTFDLSLEPGELSGAEREAVERLAAEKYRSQAWTERK